MHGEGVVGVSAAVLKGAVPVSVRNYDSEDSEARDMQDIENSKRIMSSVGILFFN